MEEVSRKFLDHYLIHTPDIRKCPNPKCKYAGTITMKACSDKLMCDQVNIHHVIHSDDMSGMTQSINAIIVSTHNSNLLAQIYIKFYFLYFLKNVLLCKLQKFHEMVFMLFLDWFLPNKEKQTFTYIREIFLGKT